MHKFIAMVSCFLVRAVDEFMSELVELPSGTVDEGESLEECLQREVKEETGLVVSKTVSLVDFFDYVSGSGKLARQFNYVVEVVPGEVVLNPLEHQSFKWIDPNTELDDSGMSSEVKKACARGLNDAKLFSFSCPNHALTLQSTYIYPFSMNKKSSIDTTHPRDPNKKLSAKEEARLKKVRKIAQRAKKRVGEVLRDREVLHGLGVEVFLPVEQIQALMPRPLINRKLAFAEYPEEKRNHALERSISKLVMRNFFFPEVFAELRYQIDFQQVVQKYLQTHYPNQSPLPNNQVYFKGSLAGVPDEVYIVHLAETLDNELFIADIVTQNPLGQPNQSGDFEGLGHGVFMEFLQRLEDYAASNHYQQIGLVAASRWQKEMFERRGFVFEEDTPFGQYALMTDQGFPMNKRVKEKVA